MEPSPESTAPVPRWLALGLGRGRYALHVDDVSGVVEAAAVRPVPLAPPGVLGLSEWRGRLLTVVDLAQVLHELPGEGPASLVRLAAPLQHTALLVRGALRLVAADDDELDEPSIGGCRHARLDPARLIAGLELATGGGDPAARPRGDGG